MIPFYIPYEDLTHALKRSHDKENSNSELVERQIFRKECPNMMLDLTGFTQFILEDGKDSLLLQLRL